MLYRRRIPLRVKLTTVESLQLAIVTPLLAATVVLGNVLCRWIVHFQARKLRETERDALIRDIEVWLEVQRGQTA